MPPKFDKNNYTDIQKKNIALQIKDISQEEAIKDFDNLKKIACNGKDNNLSRVGNKVVDRFTIGERLETKGKKGINFYDLYYNRFKLTQPSIESLLKYNDTDTENATVKNWYSIMNLYYGSISIFRPLIAIEAYCKYKPTAILDFTMGWGGRLVGACALDIKKYIGIDNNKDLRKPYTELKKLMNKHSNTDIELYFTDAVKFDYSKLEYDMVLTSPPYYNIEEYEGQVTKTKDEWDRDFYEPVFRNTFNNMKKGGYYCLNIPEELYERVALKLFKKPTHKIRLNIKKRKSESKYKEFIYVWKKNI
tara:strand:- start:2470 stop:3384 length:915 start_codon:yes stop_codon:yes gene_type:complete